MSQKLGSLARKLTKGGLDIFFNFLTLKTFESNKPLKKARPFSSLVILMRVKHLTKIAYFNGEKNGNRAEKCGEG